MEKHITRRELLAGMATLAAGAALLPLVPRASAFQWPEQSSVTASGSTARIAPPNEPGEALVIYGQVYAGDGRPPAANVVLYGYHTDASGLYRADHYTPDWQTRR